MKKRVKLFPFVLSLALCLGLLSGCGNAPAAFSTPDSAPSASSAEPAAPTTPPQETAASTPESTPEDSVLSIAEDATDDALSLNMDYEVPLPIVDTPETFTMWTGVAPFAAGAISSEDDMQLYGIVADMTGIHFDVTIVNGMEEETQFNLMVAAGDYTDIVTGMGYYSTGIPGALNDGIIVDLLDYVQEFAPHYWDFISASKECKATLITDEGQMGTIATTYQETGLENIGLAIRGDWLDELGMTAPETYDDLYVYGKAALDKYGASFCFFADGNTPQLSMGLGVIAGEYMTYDQKVQHFIEVPGYYDYLEMMSQWYAEGVIYKDFFTLADNTSNGDLFCDGTCSLNEIGANVMHALYEKVETSSGARFLGIQNPVTEPGGTLPCSSEVPMINDYDAWAITTSCPTEGIPALMQLVDFMYSDTGARMWNYGTEGESYIINDQGQPEYTELITAPADGTMSAVAQYYYASINVPSRNDMRKGFYSFDDAAWEALDLFATQLDGSNCYPAAAQQCLTTAEAEQYAAVSSDVETYVDAEILKFITGAAPLTREGYDAFVATAESMGLSKMDEIYQSAYDRYLEKTA